MSFCAASPNAFPRNAGDSTRYDHDLCDLCFGGDGQLSPGFLRPSDRWKYTSHARPVIRKNDVRSPASLSPFKPAIVSTNIRGATREHGQRREEHDRDGEPLEVHQWRPPITYITSLSPTQRLLEGGFRAFEFGKQFRRRHLGEIARRAELLALDGPAFA